MNYEPHGDGKDYFGVVTLYVWDMVTDELLEELSTCDAIRATGAVVMGFAVPEETEEDSPRKIYMSLSIEAHSQHRAKKLYLTVTQSLQNISHSVDVASAGALSLVGE
jgi:hypothetical protein